GDFRALILVANPEGLERFRLSPFDAEAQIRAVQSALGSIPYELLARSEAASGPPTLDCLCDRITGGHFTLLHLVCHGRFARVDGEPLLFLSKPDGTVDPVAASRLIARLEKLCAVQGLPQFTFLASCESADPEAEGVSGGLAQRLVRDLGMPAVVAMTDRISVESARA